MSSSRACCTQFWLRKLHSFSGFLFLGYFLCVHVRNAGVYRSDFARVFLLYLPLLFHGLYGLYVTYESKPNLLQYRWIRNWMYFTQRMTGVLLVPFIALHIGAVKWGAAYSERGWYIAIWYAGVVAAVSHLANGAFGTMIDWGVTVGPYSQRVLVGLSVAAFLVLSAYGIHTLYTAF